MVDQVAHRERLLQHQEPEPIQLQEVLEVVQVVGCIGVGRERDLRVALPYRAHRLDVPARLELDLDPPVAFLQVLGDDRQQLV